MGFNKELKTLSIKQKLAMHYVSKESKLTRVGERYGETMDVHGAGAQRSDPKTNQSSGKASNFVERLDQDGDSRVSGSEFHGPPAHFNHFDSNRDGYITQDEAPKGPPPRGRDL